MNTKIAVIGISVKLPDAADLDSFHWNLIRRKCSISEISEERKKLLGLSDDISYHLAEIDDIDLFDNEFFSISNREAKAMFPEMRLSMEQAVKAIWDAGYSLDELRGSSCGVIVTQSPGNYKKYLSQRDAFSFVGNQGAMTAGHIAYHLDLRGPNMQLASTCSSSLMSVHEASKMLALGEADLMLVGGAQISMLDPEDMGEMHTLGIVSDKPECIPFSNKASGTQCGEASAFILLKRYDDAIRDKDKIYSVIRSTAVNSNGADSGNLTAPSLRAEAEVIKKAWDSCGITCDDITEIETHGTATKSGDPIEIEGILRCLDSENNKPPIYLGAVKSNIGHTISMAGLTSLIKVITGFENNVCYPVCGLDEQSSVAAGNRIKPLSEPVFYSPDEKRIAGVSAYGFSGNNVHAVVENIIGNRDISREPDSFNRILKLSARTTEAAESYIKALSKKLSDCDTDVNSFVYTLNTGRDDYAYRAVIRFSSLCDLTQKLSSVCLEKSSPEGKYEIRIGSHKENSMSDDPRVQAYIASHFSDIPKSVEKPAVDAAVFAILKNVGIKAEVICSDEYGELVKALSEAPENINEMTEKFEALAEPSSETGYGLYDDKGIIADLTQLGAIEAAVSELYIRSAKLDWRGYYPHAYEKIHLPCDIFTRKQLWGDAVQVKKQDVSSTISADEDIIICSDLHSDNDNELIRSSEGSPVEGNNSEKNDIKSIILDSWRKALDNEDMTEEDSFFEIGGNSLTAMMIIDKLNSSLGCDLTVDDLYMYDTVAQLAEYIEGEL